MTTSMITTDTQQQVDSSNPTREALEEELNAEDLSDDIPEFPPCEMQFIMKQDDLLEALTIVMKALCSRATLPVLSHVLVATRTSALDRMPAHVVFTCSNLETAISMQCNAKVVHEGTFTIPAKTLLECVKTFSKGRLITVQVMEPYVQVQCGKRVFKLKGGMDASEFPAWKEMIVGEGAPFALDTDLLRQAIKEVQFAAADDYSRPIFNCICLHIQEETLTLVTLDGCCMAVRTITMPTKMRERDAFLPVPVASMRILADVMPNACPVVIIWNKDTSHVVFQAGWVQVSIRLVAGPYPNYRSLTFKPNTASFTAPRKDLNQIVKAFKPFAQSNDNIFTLSYNKEKGTVSCLAASEELGEAYDEIEVPVEGTDGHIIFNIRYLIDLLKHVPVDAFVFKLTTEDRPGLITPLGREDYSLALMPMRCNR